MAMPELQYKVAVGAARNSESMIDEITEVTRYLTPDGEEHRSRESAEFHLKRMADVAAANKVLDEGGSVADALKLIGYGEVPEILERVTKDTKLVIEYWQCRDTPGYQVRYVEMNGRLWVFGNAGSWSGSYGNSVTVADLVRYAQNPRTEF